MDPRPVDKDVQRDRAASKRYRERERGALMAVALDVLDDPTADPVEHALARKQLASPNLDEINVNRYTSLQLVTLEALIAHGTGERTIGDLELRVVGEERVVHRGPCPDCAARSERVYLDVTDLDVDSRGYLEESVLPELRGAERDERAQPLRLTAGGNE